MASDRFRQLGENARAMLKGVMALADEAIREIGVQSGSHGGKARRRRRSGSLRPVPARNVPAFILPIVEDRAPDRGATGSLRIIPGRGCGSRPNVVTFKRGHSKAPTFRREPKRLSAAPAACSKRSDACYIGGRTSDFQRAHGRKPSKKAPRLR